MVSSAAVGAADSTKKQPHRDLHDSAVRRTAAAIELDVAQANFHDVEFRRFDHATQTRVPIVYRS